MSNWNDIGEELRRKREKAGLVFADISHQTRITTATLKALEINDYSHFASPAYAKSFLQQYSEHLGIDAHEWLQSFDTSTVLSDLDSYNYLNPDPEDQARGRNGSRSRNHRDARSVNTLPIILFLLSVAIIIGFFYGYIYIDNLINNPIGDNPDESSQTAGKQKSTSKVKDNTSSPPTPAKIAPEEIPTPVRPVIIPDDTPIPRAILVPEDGESTTAIEVSETE